MYHGGYNMKKEETNVKSSKTQLIGLKITFSSMMMIICLMVELYVMLSYPITWMNGVIAIVLLFSVYVFTSSILQLKYLSQSREEEIFDELMKSSKATYLMMRKYFDEIQEQLDDIEEKMGIPVDDIMNAQKGIAKISISRSKENADALMNSNDKLLEKIFNLEEKLDSVEGRLVATQKSVSEEANQDIIIKQQELANLIKEIEVGIKKEILSVQAKVQSQPQQIVMPQPTMVAPPTFVTENQKQELYQSEQPSIKREITDDELDDMITKANELLSEEAGQLNESEDPLGEIISFEEPSEEDNALEIPAEPEISIEPEIGLEPEIPMEPEIGLEPEIPMEPEIGLEPEISMEPEIELEPEIPMEPEIGLEPEIPMEPEIGLEPEIPMEPEIGLEPEIPVEPEPIEEEKPPMPDLSDPNHVMTPDEIAALLANM